VELQGRLQRDVNRVKVLREEERVHSGEARDGSSYGGKSGKGPGEGAKVKGFTARLQLRKNQDSNPNLKAFY